ncbi:MAG: hypothetical protein A2790_23560 [Phenylobacterium sp. RIFCSPHIGHO2_01_FULL_69_31]|nr:MAG: hypothetical protein A2790_23560 [Phenylobacterium sp. RIFCSPHIGHO2_01_FULL_69_31]
MRLEPQMIVLKVKQTDEGLAIVLNPEAQDLLGAADGQSVGFQVSEDGQLTIGTLDMSFEARRARGRAFLKRYDKTFQALAK